MTKYVDPTEVGPKLIVSYLYSPEGATISLWQRHIGWMSQIFPTPSHLAPSFGVTPSNLWKSTIPETRVFQAADGEDLVILACTDYD